jgi:hypothetical protein
LYFYFGFKPFLSGTTLPHCSVNRDPIDISPEVLHLVKFFFVSILVDKHETRIIYPVNLDDNRNVWQIVMFALRESESTKYDTLIIAS